VWWTYERGSLWSIALAQSRSAPEAAESPAVWAEATAVQASELSVAMGCSDRQVEERLERGARCFTASIDGELAAYGWVTPGSERIGELERLINLGSDEAYIWDCVTLPGYRRRGLYSGLLRRMVAALSEEAFRRIWIGASLSNRPSHRGFLNAGFRPALSVVYLRLGSRSCLYAHRLRGASKEIAGDAVRVLAAPEERRWGPLLVRRLCSSGLESCSGVEG
jgi:ribosomal protein S18 acetylase RimI-like enzyme